MPGVAFVLQGAHLDTLARLTLPLTNLNNSLSQHDCYSTLRRIQALHSPTTTPITAWLSGLHTITVYTQKKAAAKVYKLLLSNQAQLGITVGPVKQCITLGIQSRAELTDALCLAVTTGLQTCGWHKLSESRLLSSNPYIINNTFNITTTTTCASITVAVEPVSSSSIIVLIKPEIVTFRHPFACTTSISNVLYSPTPTNTSTGTIISPLIGTRCTLLPNLLPALIAGIDQDKTQQHKDLIEQWNVLSLGLFNPSTSISIHSPSSQLLVKVRLTDDPDAPTITVPASCILSSSGLDVTGSYSLKKNPRIAQLLARLQTELPQAAAGICSLPSTSSTSSCDGGETSAVDDGQQQSAVKEVVEKICVWNYEKEEEKGGERDRLISKPSPFTPGFQSADKILNQPSPFSSTIMSLLGPTIDLNADVVGDGTANTAPTTTADALAVTKPRVTAGPQLKGFIAKLKEQEEEENQLLGAAAYIDRGTAAGKKAVVAFNGLPTSGARSSIKTPAFVSKRGAFSLSSGNIIAAKKGLLTSSINNKKKAKLASTGTRLPTTTTTTAAAAAKPKKPATVEIDPASLNIPQLVQSDKLSTITIPQLKAYLKSVKKPVGGKKSDLEERVKQHVNAML